VVVQDSPDSAISFGQQGVVTAGTVNLEPREARLTWPVTNEPQPDVKKFEFTEEQEHQLRRENCGSPSC
jgi:hypothetical protein